MSHSGKLVINRRGMLSSTAATAAAAALSSFGQNVLNAELVQTATLVEATLEGRIEAAGNGPKVDGQFVRFKVMGIDVAFPFKSLEPYIPEFFPYPVREPGDPLPPAPPAPTTPQGPFMPCRIRVPLSPASFLTPSEFVGKKPGDHNELKNFPGRAEKGFEGAQVTVYGVFDVAAAPGQPQMIAYTIDVQPEETVIVGPLTSNTLGQDGVSGVSICGVPVLLQTDTRLVSDSDPTPARTAKFLNDHYLPMIVATAALGTANVGNCTVEGYFASGNFYASRFVAGNAGTLQPDAAGNLSPMISVDRVRIRDSKPGYLLEARGGIYMPGLMLGDPGPSIRISRVDIDTNGARRQASAADGKIAVVADIRIDGEGLAQWRVSRAAVTKSGGSASFLQTPPERVLIELLGPNGVVVASVECGTDWRP